MTGYSVFEDGVLCKHGVFKIKNCKAENSIERMRDMYEFAEKLIKSEHPDRIAIEGVQYQQNMRAYSTLSQLQGVLFGLFFSQDIGFLVVEPSAWRAHFRIANAKRNVLKERAIQIAGERYGVSMAEDEAEAVLIGQWMVDQVDEINTAYKE